MLDRQLDLAWANLSISGTRYVRAVDIRGRISSLSHRDKKDNLAGLQLADLVVSPVGRHIMGKPAREDWRIIEEKFRRRGGSYLGSGLVCLPREDKK